MSQSTAIQCLDVQIQTNYSYIQPETTMYDLCAKWAFLLHESILMKIGLIIFVRHCFNTSSMLEKDRKRENWQILWNSRTKHFKETLSWLPTLKLTKTWSSLFEKFFFTYSSLIFLIRNNPWQIYFNYNTQEK